MRPVTQGDILAAARRLTELPRSLWSDTLQSLLSRTDAGDRFRKRLGRCHRNLGNGTVYDAVTRMGPLPAEPLFSDERYLEALAEVIHHVLEWKARQKVKI